jgi:vacuolar-type H+-ATPase subunit C/Vma6
VSPGWDALNARARGLESHFLTRDALEALARAPDLGALADAMRREGVVAGDAGEQGRSGELDLAIRRWAAGMLRTLARWAGPRSEALPFVFDDEDRRSIRAMLRGAVQHATPEDRLAALIPTPTLPARALDTLARTATPAGVVAHLATWRHPFAPDLRLATSSAEPDLYHLEIQLARAAAERARRAALASHDAQLTAWVRATLDLENAVAAIALATEGTDVVPRELFLPGGARVDIVAFEEAITTHEPLACGRRLARALAGTPCGAILAHGGRATGSLEDELLRCRIAAMRRQVGVSPLGPLAVVYFALRLRAQVLDLERIVWTVALGAPGGELAANLTTAAR